ncbi:MAG TPA: hypothetical protein VHZ24_00450 [Pirellulales bacterium]|jgi:DNA-directed RNA polymerase subunit RPC12/RpoP|nr:hypothetical protein [Pirellulales bacterium]
MNVTFSCPHCDQTVRVEVDDSTPQLACPSCGAQSSIPAGAIRAGQPTRCLLCPSTELFVRKDFPQRLGVAVVVLGGVASSIAWYYYRIYLTFAILLAIAAIDVVLYLLVGESLTCYRCGAEYRGVDDVKRHGMFDLATHERHRQQAARLARRL